MNDQIPSTRKLAPHVGRSAKTVCKWTQRRDWPFGPAPWPVSLVPDIRAWRDTHLQHTGEQEKWDDDGGEGNGTDPRIPALREALDLMAKAAEWSERLRLDFLAEMRAAVDALPAWIRSDGVGSAVASLLAIIDAHTPTPPADPAPDESTPTT